MPVINKRVKLTIKEKTEILEKLDNNAPASVICREYKIHKSTISRLKKNKNALRQFVANAESGSGKRRVMRVSEYPKMEKSLYRWFLTQREKHLPISGTKKQ